MGEGADVVGGSPWWAVRAQGAWIPVSGTEMTEGAWGGDGKPLSGRIAA